MQRLISRCYATAATSLSKTRNIGIIAHIDAGKTTTTERMLFYSGITSRIGNVDQGDTVTDYLPQERDRGITIQSAAITIPWKQHRINLIDTPGHADFTFEVIRSLRVLDGCVTILDAVAGVEAQTEKVWKQASALGIPKIVFVNKMDRDGSGYSRTVKEVISKLETKVLLCNVPYFVGDRDRVFTGVLDIVNKQLIEWKGEDITVTEVAPGTDMYKEVAKCRESLVETLSEVDESVVDSFFETEDYMAVPAELLSHAIRKATLSRYAVPVLCGASFRNIGVQPLLEAIVDYLPSPVDSTLPLPEIKVQSFQSRKRTAQLETLPAIYDSNQGLLINNNKHLCVALAFKVITDPIRGVMVFVRVYSGKLTSGNMVFNTRTNEKIRIGKLVLMHANVPEEVSSLGAGNIGVITGTHDQIVTGDTIVTHSLKKDGLKSLNENECHMSLNPIAVPPPVFSVSIEPRTMGDKKGMDDALATLTREDPSLVVSVDEETGQTLLSGMGELHLDIARDRLLSNLKAKVEIGKVMVTYKEELLAPASHHVKLDNGYEFGVTVEPFDGNVKDLAEQEFYYLGSDNNYLIVEGHPESIFGLPKWPLQISYEDIVRSFISSSVVGLQRGGKIARFPLYSTIIRVTKWNLPLDVTSHAQMLTLSRQGIQQALASLDFNLFGLLEPIMDVKVSVTAQDVGNVIQDLTAARKGNIVAIEDTETGDAENNYNDEAEKQYLPRDPTMEFTKLSQEGNAAKVVHARVPLKEMVAYLSKLRSLTQGRGTFHMEYYGMERVTIDRVQSIVEEF